MQSDYFICLINYSPFLFTGKLRKEQKTDKNYGRLPRIRPSSIQRASQD
jgi:hypothetical protein